MVFTFKLMDQERLLAANPDKCCNLILLFRPCLAVSLHTLFHYVYPEATTSSCCLKVCQMWHSHLAVPFPFLLASSSFWQQVHHLNLQFWVWHSQVPCDSGISRGSAAPRDSGVDLLPTIPQHTCLLNRCT